jgi:hypothetical protein
VSQMTADSSSHHDGHDHHDDHGHGHHYDKVAVAGKTFHSHFGPIDLTEANTHPGPGFANGLKILLLVIGVVCLGATLAFPFITTGYEKAAKHAWSAYHVGAMSAISIMLGGLVLTMIFRLVQAGWSTTIRRQTENIASLLPLSVVFVLPYLFAGEKLWKWMSSDPAIQGDYLLQKKSPYLNAEFMAVRIVAYLAIWSYLGWRMYSLSRKQDESGDINLTLKAQRESTWGTLAFALTSTFAAFDLVMSMDFHWFSTMFGVYFFAGSILSAICLTVLMLALIRSTGKMNKLVTSEHLHDLGKLLKGFTIFWAYIAFSQYFLIWYANIPEETAWVLARRSGGFDYIFLLMCFGHFMFPFIILLFRGVKKNWTLLAFFALWQIAMHIMDMFWQIRPNVNLGFGEDGVVYSKVGFHWVDITGAIGPVALMLGLLVWRMGKGPFIPLRDPRLHEALNHKNYV